MSRLMSNHKLLKGGIHAASRGQKEDRTHVEIVLTDTALKYVSTSKNKAHF